MDQKAVFCAIREWLHWGTDRCKTSTQRRKVLLCNVTALVGTASVLLFDIGYLVSGSAPVMTLVWYHLPVYGGFLLIPWLNRSGRHLLASWMMSLLAMWGTLMPILLVFGTYLDFHYYFVLFAVIPFVFFPDRHWFSIACMVATNTLLFIGFQLKGMAPVPEVLALDRHVVMAIRGIFAFLTVSTLAFFFLLFDHLTRDSELRLEQISMMDSLTGLPNRRYFESVFCQEAARTARADTPMSIALLDIDFFKKVNDTYGHDVGDDVLRHVAMQARCGLRAGNVIARLGGEEFAVLLPSTPPASALIAMERVRKSIEANEYRSDGVTLKVTASIGVAAVTRADTFEAALKQADLALYEAKRKGRNSVRFRAREEEPSDAAMPRDLATAQELV